MKIVKSFKAAESFRINHELNIFQSIFQIFSMLFCFFAVAFLPIFIESRRLSIINGQKSDIAEFPYQLSMSYDGFFTCGASIISTNFALTAGDFYRLFNKKN